MYKVKISILCVYTFDEFAHIPWENTPDFPKPPERNKFLQKPLVKGPGVSLLSLTRWQRKPFQQGSEPSWYQLGTQPALVKAAKTMGKRLFWQASPSKKEWRPHHRQTQKERLAGQPREKLGDVNFMCSVSKCCELSDASRHRLFLHFSRQKVLSQIIRAPQRRGEKQNTTNFVWGILEDVHDGFPQQIQHFQPTLGGWHDTWRSVTHLATRHRTCTVLQTSLGAWDFVKLGGQR